MRRGAFENLLRASVCLTMRDNSCGLDRAARSLQAGTLMRPHFPACDCLLLVDFILSLTLLLTNLPIVAGHPSTLRSPMIMQFVNNQQMALTQGNCFLRSLGQLLVWAWACYGLAEASGSEVSGSMTF